VKVQWQIIGLFGGWTAAWLILRQRLVHHQELLENYRNVMDEKIPGTPIIPAHRTALIRLVGSLLISGTLITVIGGLLSYFADNELHAAYAGILMLIGLMVIIIGAGLFFGPSSKASDKVSKDHPS
jgi:hypothetical protein